jgi:hypothetical protein
LSDGDRDGGRTGRQGGDEGLDFHYDRQRRLERAPEAVRWLASRREGKRPSFMKSLFASRANRVLLYLIIALALAYNVVPLLSGPRSSGRLGDDRYAAKAFWFEGKVFVSLAREAGKADAGEAFPIVVTAAALAGRGAEAATGRAVAKASYAAGRAAKEDFRLSIECPEGKPAKALVLVERGAAALKLEVAVE